MAVAAEGRTNAWYFLEVCFVEFLDDRYWLQDAAPVSSDVPWFHDKGSPCKPTRNRRGGGSSDKRHKVCVGLSSWLCSELELHCQCQYLLCCHWCAGGLVNSPDVETSTELEASEFSHVAGAMYVSRR